MTDRTKFEVGHLTHPGRKRDHNEDSLGFFEPEDPDQLAERGAIYIVADGMGGHEAGAVASDRAWRKVIDEYYYGDPSLGVKESLERAISIANEEIYRLASRNPTWTGMGSTIVAAVLRGENELYVANVGDSRAYLVRGDEIRQITKDHSWVQQQMDSGILTPEEARRHPRRSAITRSLGRRPDVQVDVFDEEQFFPDDKLILCSDGLSDVVRDEEIKKIVSEYKPQEAVQKMVDVANHRGGPDNITAIAISYPTGVSGPTGVLKWIVGLGILVIVAMAAVFGLRGIIWPEPTPTPGSTSIVLPTPSPTTPVPPTPTPVPPTPTIVTPTPTPVPPTSTPTPTPSTPTPIPSPTPSEAVITAPTTTPTSSPTPTPSPTPEPTSTVGAVIPTATHTPVPARPTPTYTLTPTPISTLLPAPTLREPKPGASLESDSVILRWEEWTRELENDEWFVVSIHTLSCAADMPPDRTEKVRVYELKAPLGVRGCNYAWKVVVMRERADGTLVEVSEPSQEWSFWWVLPTPGEEPTSTPEKPTVTPR